MKYYFFSVIFIFLYSCTPNPCPELTLRKPSAYSDEYLTYLDKVDLNRKYILYTGRCSTYDLDTLSSIRSYKDGYDDGNWTFYYKNGEIETKGKFKMGKRVGEWKYYYENGNLKQVAEYMDGQRSGTWYSLNINGDTLSKKKYLNGKLIN